MNFVPETGSTNADLAARLARGDTVREGDWLVAQRQSAGRGRLGRAWFDGLGNFMGSTVVHLAAGDPPPGTLALAAGLAVHGAVSDHVPPPHLALLKWPNDVMIGAAKLSGILLERAGDAVIVGIGVNLAVAPEVEGRQTTALAAFGPPPDWRAFAENLARAFAADLERWRGFGTELLVRRWLGAAHPRGTPLVVGEPGEEPLQGRFDGLSGDGALQLRLADGTTRIINAGEVRLADGN